MYVDALSDEALTAARSRLNPGAGAMLSALWVPGTGQLALMIHHLAVDGVSWRILLEDFNIAWAQHHSGQPVELPTGGTSFQPAGLRCWMSMRAASEVVELADTWREVTSVRRRCLRCNPAVDTYATAKAIVGVVGCRHHPPAAR